PPCTYGAMDFATRDNYRHAIELIARRGGLAEDAVAMQVLELAQAHAAQAGSHELACHVGYYLIDEGRARLEDALALRGLSRGVRAREAGALQVLELAQAHAAQAGSHELACQVGYYLTDEGRARLEDALALRGVTRSVRRTARRLPLLAYTLPGALVVALFTW